ncbi:[FeFe] hydrogenase H-cluster radical SAM maturase HydG [Treponema endosymbiont of Eucomonympha sp.]|uniref:[FeFe] hydrogenase H-cluster radical SAM maturase HydG n=1 Tax=Treponema endosymbiont of Eucomonympha sp. TaxID=1580831 RepID=UPI000751558A|nr:[FeFe] hydrogenase H-cluster radical SAM maturase HydG [Treponema endosymbiont of Eucomonympha sp.]
MATVPVAETTKNTFIDAGYISGVLECAKGATDAEIRRILDKAERFEGASHTEIAALLMTEKPEHIARIFDIAGKIKRHIYGNRIVLFAPLYVSDYCVNRCAYCSYNCGHDFPRRKLTMDEVREETKLLEQMGHKRIALEAGEHGAECPIEYILECIGAIYGMKFKNGEIRRINVNIAATTTENYRKLNAVGIGTYILFQETYHQPTYEQVHLAGPKRNFDYHLTAFDRAHEAGIGDVGGGVLFGLADPRFEVLALMIHNEHLDERFHSGFHTISVPRLCAASGMSLADFPHLVDDATFERVVAIIRLAVPFTGMILSTRESHEMRGKLLKLGISQISAGSSTEVGGYAKRARNEAANPQFYVNDERDALDIISELMGDGYIPSFCTACYRSGRTGDRFMSLAKSGQIKNVCLPNALMTLTEYAMDYGGEAFRAKAFAAIGQNLPGIANERMRTKAAENIEQIKRGAHDFYV